MPPMILDPFDDDSDGEPSAAFLRLGIQFPDGASVTNLDRSPWELSPDATEPLHGMASSGGGGSDNFDEQEWWAWPIPDPGVLTFVCEWPAYEIPETHRRSLVAPRSPKRTGARPYPVALGQRSDVRTPLDSFTGHRESGGCVFVVAVCDLHRVPALLERDAAGACALPVHGMRVARLVLRLIRL